MRLGGPVKPLMNSAADAVGYSYSIKDFADHLLQSAQNPSSSESPSPKEIGTATLDEQIMINVDDLTSP